MMKTTLTHSLTLRISPELNLMILDAAYEARLSKQRGFGKPSTTVLD